MRKTMVIPTYWSRRSGEPWQEGDAIYDHPTPVDQEGTLERTLVSMKRFREKDFKLVKKRHIIFIYTTGICQ